ncbi:hypothetical protein LO772_19850 [Yinghuangia sp. ASG 101]|uniref:hypothetical protein n=1 Tax=Yinghuangia sp. ASG 101 TaxID=2896848 RepID=UPI001E6273C4|nr:hypothetical protein [Yinghuangia sp. ASG 101]UGQ09206.1 hypothetical protein LO772_19850 [Yinghuangia sp. ASG 101]
MDSVTRPVGHLPPSVYWRRRAIVLVALAVLIALVAFACTAGGGGGDDKKNASSESSSPPPSAPESPGVISPGAPSAGGPVQPGAAAGGATGGDGAPAAPGTTGGSAGGPAGGDANGSAATAGATGAAGAADGGATGTNGQGQAPQPGAANGGAGGANGGNGLLMCQSPATQLKLTGDRPENTRFRVGEQVKLTLEIRNTGTETCAVDMAQTSATVEIRSGNDIIWSPGHCASNQQVITQIQPGKSVVHTWTWNWTRSDPARCSGPVPTLATPPPGALFVAKGTVAGVNWASNEYKWLVAG